VALVSRTRRQVNSAMLIRPGATPFPFDPVRCRHCCEECPAARTAPDLICSLLPGRCACDIQFHSKAGDALGLEGHSRGPEGFGVDVGDGDGQALAAKGPGDAETNAACASGNQRDLIRIQLHAFAPRFLQCERQSCRRPRTVRLFDRYREGGRGQYPSGPQKRALPTNTCLTGFQAIVLQL